MYATLEAAHARIAELEAQLAAAPKPRAARKPATAECQQCGDTKRVKIEHMGLPLCREVRLCMSSARRPGAPQFIRLTVNPYRTVKRDGRYLATWNGDVIGIGASQAEARRIGWARFVAERDGAVAVSGAA